MDIDRLLSERFTCSKCGSHGANVRKLAMSGVGLSRLLDVQPNRYAFVSCQRCGFTEVYDLRTLEGAVGKGMDILDVLFS